MSGGKNSRTMNMILIGPPGAGKGTQAGYLVKAYSLPHISTGDMLRQAVSEGTAAGKEIQDYMTKGELVPDSIVDKAVVERLSKPDMDKGFILDGYPRNRSQAESLDSSLPSIGAKIDIVLNFETSEEVVLQRLCGRRVCPSCGFNFHITNIPPKVEGICDKCDGNVELIQREDDKPDTIKNRLSVYRERTEDLIGYYRGKGLLRDVNGDLPAEKLFEEIDSLFRREGLVDGDFKG